MNEIPLSHTIFQFDTKHSYLLGLPPNDPNMSEGQDDRQVESAALLEWVPLLIEYNYSQV